MRIIRRLFIILPFLAIHIAWIALLCTVLKPYAAYIYLGLSILSVWVLLYLISRRQEACYKILWILLVMLMPIPATLAYLMVGDRRTALAITKYVDKAKKDMPELSEINPAAIPCEERYDERISKSLQYITNLSGFPINVCESAQYYPIGEECWKAMLEEIKKAEKFIFLEYFIVEDGKMWSAMCELFEQKIKAGVDVRFIYDDLGSLATFGKSDDDKLTRMGMNWISFNEVKFIHGSLNNRTHRKMLIIDGKVAFSGGVNLADEYINEMVKFGHWKDIGFKITGPSVENYLHMFVQFWNAFSKDKISNEVFDLVPKESVAMDGGVLSYYDSPANRDPVSNNFYIEMLGNAKDYAWFYTPYLMLGDTLLDAFVRAAKRGVDVRIIMPGIPDKKLVFRMSRSFYGTLLEAGVKIYEYTPGFVHAKASLYDDEICTIGTVNLDYRSLYLHFENNSVFWKSSILDELKKDYLDTLSKCNQISEKDIKKGFLGKLLDEILRIVVPLC